MRMEFRWITGIKRTIKYILQSNQTLLYKNVRYSAQLFHAIHVFVEQEEKSQVLICLLVL